MHADSRSDLEMKISFKPGVSLYGLQPEMLWALDRCLDTATGDVVVTSARGDKHSRASLHYVGLAFDLRTRHLSQERIRNWIRELKLVLIDYDIVFEGTHLHIEYQPKNAYQYPTKQPYQ